MSATTRGRNNRAKGNEAERELCRWLNDIFDLGAKTSRAVGHGTQSLHGDIMIPGHPDIVIEVKNTQGTAVARWLDQLADECGHLVDPLPMLAWRTSPRVEEWVWIVPGIASPDLPSIWSTLTTATMRDIAAAVRLGFDDCGELQWTPFPFELPALICSGRMAADIIGERVVGGES